MVVSSVGVHPAAGDERGPISEEAVEGTNVLANTVVEVMGKIYAMRLMSVAWAYYSEVA